ncbi:MAG: BolA family transcriptional regulator [Bdellovibrionales bacterium]|nr:BolA family transcriptional regulator [Bdellovibrionales bacterium]
MTLSERITDKITNHLHPIYFSLENESDKHAKGGSESHFKLLVVSTVFIGLNRVQRQRKIYQILAEELKNGVHALAQRALTPQEWEQSQQDFKTPDCQGHQ